MNSIQVTKNGTKIMRKLDSMSKKQHNQETTNRPPKTSGMDYV